MSSHRKAAPVAGDYTRAQVCEILNIGTAKVDELVSSGALESYKLSPSRRGGRRIRRESVEALRRGRPVEVLQSEDPTKWTGEDAA